MVVGSARQPPLAMELVSNLAGHQAGDLVISSGIDGIYPKGYAIGWIEPSERGRGLYLDISVRPAVDFNSLEEVLVVLVPPRPAIDRRREAGRKPAAAQVKAVVVLRRAGRGAAAPDDDRGAVARGGLAREFRPDRGGLHRAVDRRR